MKAKILIVMISLVIVTACSKDKFETKPKLTFESMNGTTFYAGQDVTIKLRLTDKEGDFLHDSTGAGYTKPYLFYERVSYICPDLNTDTSAQLFNVPAFPTSKDLDAFIDINFTYAVQGQFTTLRGCDFNRDDSTYFKVWIKDEAGHISDTVKTPVFTLIKN